MQTRAELSCKTNWSRHDHDMTVENILKCAKEAGIDKIALTDYGTVNAIEDMEELGEKVNDYGIKLIYGMSINMVDDEDVIVINAQEGDLPTEYVAMDMAVTGFSAVDEDIVEIGMMKVQHRRITDRYHAYIKPRKGLTEFGKRISKCDPKVLQDARTVEEVFPEVLKFVGDFPIVSHQCNFVDEFLFETAKRTGNVYNHNMLIDVFNIVRLLYENCKRLKFEKVQDRLRLKEKEPRNMQEAARMLVDIYTELRCKLLEKGIHTIQKLNESSLGDSTFIHNQLTTRATLLAKNKDGIDALNRIEWISDNLYPEGRDLVPKSVVEIYRDNLFVGSSGLRGNVIFNLCLHRSLDVVEKDAEFYDYFEIMPLVNYTKLINHESMEYIKLEDDVAKIIQNTVALAKKQGKLFVATCDVCSLERDSTRRTMLSMNDMLKEFTYLGDDAEKAVMVHPAKVASVICYE